MPLAGVLLLAFKVLLLVDNLAHVLDDEGARLDGLGRKEPPALLLVRIQHLRRGVLAALEALVLAVVAARAEAGRALDVFRAEEARVVVAAGLAGPVQAGAGLHAVDRQLDILAMHVGVASQQHEGRGLRAAARSPHPLEVFVPLLLEPLRLLPLDGHAFPVADDRYHLVSNQ